MQTRIKQTLSALLVFTFLAGSIASCKKDKDDKPNPNPGPNPGPVTAVLQEYRNGDEFIKFEFNGDGTVKKATLKSDVNTNGNTIDYNITYNAQKKISELDRKSVV